ncbi:hypothetical protein FB561_3879 [Kribbella amoyensis]|uniref:Uncharacterized protein n=1 Tax=Kribbella amoyensis TaxID=996641 RepID=A0A561BV42_9ACTN|nr:hypothetical protein [Kribbella amoyensis]TWD82739.1 hypothetical protein FB561_3879 [Kribbella amoyensis]
MSDKNEGLSLGYRIRWRLTWLLLHVAGPASLSDAQDPRRRMERERAARVARNQQARAVREQAPTGR